MGPPALYEIDRYEDGQNQKRKRDEDLEQGSQVAKEEVGVETAFLDKVRVGSPEDWYNPTPEARRRSSNSFSFRYEVGFWCTVGSISVDERSETGLGLTY